MNPAPGDDLGSFEREAGFAAWNRFAAVNDEFVPIHMSDDAAREAGLPAAVGMGNLTWSYFHALVGQWAGEGARIATMRCRFRRPVLAGRVSTRGMVTAVDGRRAELQLRLEDAAGVVLATGDCTVVLP